MALVAMLAPCWLAHPVHASIVGSDDASATAYDSLSWDNGDDGAVVGDAFGAWTLTSSPSGGFFVSSSTVIGSPGADINSSEGTSLGMFGQNSAEAFRSFNGGALSVGQAFSLDLAVNFRNGNKGMDLRAGSTTIFNLNVGADDYKVNVASPSGSISPNYSANTEFHLTFVQTTGTGGTWTIARSGGFTELDSGTYTGVPTNFKLYVHGTGGGAENNLMSNNFLISIVPEAGSLAMVSLAGAAMSVGAYWRRVQLGRRTLP